MRLAVSPLASVVLALVLPSSAAMADDAGDLPGARAALTTGALVGAEARVVTGDGYLAVVPALRAQLGDRQLAIGVELGLAAVRTDDPALTGDATPTASGIAPANLVVDGKVVRCRRDRRLCAGLELSLGVAALAPDTPGRLAGLHAGTAAHRGRLSRYVERGLVVEPLALAAWARGRYHAQLAVGPALLFTRDDVDLRRFQLHLGWDVELARWLGPRVALALGAGGTHDLRPRLAEWPRKDVTRHLGAVSLAVHLRAGPWRPLVRLTVPVGGYRELASAVVTVAASRPLP